MQLDFLYTIEKEFDNFRRSFASANHSVPSQRQKDFFKRYSALTPENARAYVENYLAEQKISIPEKLLAIQNGWRTVESEYFKRADAIFRTTLPIPSINVFLTVHDRCSYSFEQSEFFIHLNLPYANKTIMHELWHWYCWFTVGKKIQAEHGPAKFNEIKEALTVLLNEEFQDLLNGVQDRGYPQHANVRQRILDTYRNTKDVYQTIERSLTTS